jgi:hypothetical protein
MKTRRCGQAEDIQQCRGKVDHSERSCDSPGLVISAGAQEKWHAYEFLRQLERSMEATAVLQELLSVICGDGKRALVPSIQIHQPLREAANLGIGPADTGVVEPYDLVSLAAQTLWPNIAARPKGIQISCLLPRDPAMADRLERLRFRIVRSVRIHQMQPQKKWTVRMLVQPCKRVVYDDIG